MIDEAQKVAVLTKDKAAALLVHIINGVGNIFGIYCDFVSEMIQGNQELNSETNPQKYENILKIYCFFWKQYSTAIVSIDQQFSKINKVVNEVYSVIEKDDDIDEDAQQFSVLR